MVYFSREANRPERPANPCAPGLSRKRSSELGSLTGLRFILAEPETGRHANATFFEVELDTYRQGHLFPRKSTGHTIKI